MAPRSRNALTFTAGATGLEQLALSIQVAWQSWSGLMEVTVEPATMAAFATELRDFASHQRLEARLTAGTVAQGHLELVIAEYGLSRKAAVGIHLAHAYPAHGGLDWPVELRLQLPTEHGLLGEFGADLAQLLAADSGTATLRLLSRWPG
jgi:hypothetical protein